MIREHGVAKLSDELDDQSSTACNEKMLILHKQLRAEQGQSGIYFLALESDA